jgi:hypothetical protein
VIITDGASADETKSRTSVVNIQGPFYYACLKRNVFCDVEHKGPTMIVDYSPLTFAVSGCWQCFMAMRNFT